MEGLTKRIRRRTSSVGALKWIEVGMSFGMSRRGDKKSLHTARGVEQGEFIHSEKLACAKIRFCETLGRGKNVNWPTQENLVYIQTNRIKKMIRKE